MTLDPTRTPAEIVEQLNKQADAYDARRDAAAKAVRGGMSPATAARRFHVPIGFCRNVEREREPDNTYPDGGPSTSVMEGDIGEVTPEELR